MRHRVQQAEHEGWFAHFQAQDTWSNARRDAELREFLFGVDQLRGRLIRLEDLNNFALEMVLDPSCVELYFLFMQSSCKYRGCSLGEILGDFL